MTPLDRDVASACKWLLTIATDLVKDAVNLDAMANRRVDMANLVHACAALPGDGALRVRCTPNVFRWRA